MLIPVLGARSVLVLVDLQQWIVEMALAPIGGPEVVEQCVRLRAAFDDAVAPVVLVRYLREDGRDGGPTAAPNQFVAPLQPGQGEHVVTKNGLDAFQGTRLVAHLRDLGASSLVIAGISTAHGVGATATTAVALGYEVTVVSDATSSSSTEEHLAALDTLSAAGVKIATVDQLLS